MGRLDLRKAHQRLTYTTLAASSLYVCVSVATALWPLAGASQVTGSWQTSAKTWRLNSHTRCKRNNMLLFDFRLGQKCIQRIINVALRQSSAVAITSKFSLTKARRASWRTVHFLLLPGTYIRMSERDATMLRAPLRKIAPDGSSVVSPSAGLLTSSCHTTPPAQQRPPRTKVRCVAYRPKELSRTSCCFTVRSGQYQVKEGRRQGTSERTPEAPITYPVDNSRFLPSLAPVPQGPR